MPTNQKRIARGRINVRGITEIDYIYFSWGDFFEAEHYEDGKTQAELKAFWKAHREAIMQRYLEGNRLKGKGWEGRRPWPYFKWDVTKQRLPVDMTLSDNELYDNKKVGADGLEADYAYLKRLGLLEDWELGKYE